ncbi:MAG TPA: ABC transporter permease [Candidatus Acidoferrales bacterium]|nr:ABC transporter permease [Candidatus Acidoferrales bacterium]
MRKILLMAKRDYVESVKTKAFILGLIVAPLLFGGGFLGIAVLKKRPDLHDKRIAILDHTGVAAGAVIRAAREKNDKELFDKTSGKQIAARYVFETVPDTPDARLALSGRVRARDLFGFVEIWPAALEAPPEGGFEKLPPRAAFYTNASGIDETRAWLRDPVNRGIHAVQFARLHVPDTELKALLASVPLDSMSLVVRDPRTGAVPESKKKDEVQEFAAPFGLVLLLTMIVMVGTAPMLSAVTEDKNQRIFEMLLGLATPFELMSARVLAALGRSLTSAIFYITGALLVLQGMSMFGMVRFDLLPWFFIYLVAHVVMLCSFAAALGAACNSPQDAQNLAVILVAPVMIPYFLLVPVMQSPNGAMATVLSLVPPFTPPLMLLRQALPAGVPWWQPWAGIAGVVLWTVAGTWVAARIFRIGILMQGQPPKLAELMRWAISG